MLIWFNKIFLLLRAAAITPRNCCAAAEEGGRSPGGREGPLARGRVCSSASVSPQSLMRLKLILYLNPAPLFVCRLTLLLLIIWMWSHLFLVSCPSCQAKFHCEVPHAIFNCHLKRDSNSQLRSERVQRGAPDRERGEKPRRAPPPTSEGLPLIIWGEGKMQSLSTCQSPARWPVSQVGLPATPDPQVPALECLPPSEKVGPGAGTGLQRGCLGWLGVRSGGHRVTP